MNNYPRWKQHIFISATFSLIFPESTSFQPSPLRFQWLSKLAEDYDDDEDDEDDDDDDDDNDEDDDDDDEDNDDDHQDEDDDTIVILVYLWLEEKLSTSRAVPAVTLDGVVLFDAHVVDEETYLPFEVQVVLVEGVSVQREGTRRRRLYLFQVLLHLLLLLL